MTQAALLSAALILDALVGEPRVLWDRLPHPTVLMGRTIAWCDHRFNRGASRKIRGTVVFSGLVILAGTTGALIAALPFGWVLEVLLAAVFLAQKSLAEHVSAAAAALRLSCDEGRLVVSRIVGRVTTGLDGPAIARAAIESAAENLSDGVIAPAFWFLIAGLPGLLIYKMTNTADSMIGYHSERYEDFGWAAARFDDLLNWAPARLTAAVIAPMHFTARSWPGIRRDARLHRSPNAGWPEAAMATVLGVALAGPRSYGGAHSDFPFVNAAGRRDASARDVERSVAVLWRAWWWVLAATLAVALV